VTGAPVARIMAGACPATRAASVFVIVFPHLL